MFVRGMSCSPRMVRSVQGGHDGAGNKMDRTTLPPHHGLATGRDVGVRGAWSEPQGRTSCPPPTGAGMLPRPPVRGLWARREDWGGVLG